MGFLLFKIYLIFNKIFVLILGSKVVDSLMWDGNVVKNCGIFFI